MVQAGVREGQSVKDDTQILDMRGGWEAEGLLVTVKLSAFERVGFLNQ